MFGRTESGMGSRRNLGAVAALAAGIGLAGAPAQAHHNDWAAPLVGGALGGYALGSLVSSSEAKQKVYEEPAPVYYAPPPAPAYVAPAVPAASTIEAQLTQLDKLAAGGYITPQGYQTRRTALLNEL